MAEAAFAIVGVASSIITFIEFGVEVVSSVKQIRDSVHGVHPEISEIELVLKDVQITHANFAAQRKSSQIPKSPREQVLKDMVVECEKLARQLQVMIDELRVRPEASSKTIETWRVAMRTKRKQKDIESLQLRFETLDSRIREAVRDAMQQELGLAILSELNTLKQVGIQYESKLSGIQTEIENLTQTGSGSLIDLKLRLDLIESERAVCKKQAKVLQSLYFPELRRRWSKIHDTDEFTNDWAFERSKTTFLDWLESQNGIYWISGKAGSGKSTLMKFISGHGRAFAALDKWSNGQGFCTASYYFWNQGFEMERSQVGLLRSLLYQILRHTPRLIHHVCPERPSYERWELDDLETAFRRIGEQQELDTKFCFFIDGLDEYDGDENDIVRVLSFLSKCGSVKMCVSSRPRSFLEDRLRNAQQTFTIHYHTRDDMNRYVEKRLSPLSVMGSSVPMTDIVMKISKQAQGVWLWVFLITRDLQKAIERSEELFTLERLVDEFPPDLESYFESVIERIDPRFRKEMAQIFLVVIEEVQPLPLFAFSLLERESQDPDYALKEAVSPFPSEVAEAKKLWDLFQYIKEDRDAAIKSTMSPFPNDFLEAGRLLHQIQDEYNEIERRDPYGTVGFEVVRSDAARLLDRMQNKLKEITGQTGISPVPNNASEARRVWDRIQNRCSDLLVIDLGEHPTFLHDPVDFLHRTVREFLQDSYHDQLRTLAPAFDSLTSLCKITLFFMKRLPPPRFKERDSSIHQVLGLVDEFLYHAHEIEKKDPSPESTLVNLLDQVDQVNSEHAHFINNHWTHARDLPTNRGRDTYYEGGKCTFLALTIQARLVKYVRAKLESDPELIKNKRGRPLLDYALRPRRVTAINMPYHSQREDPSVDVNMVKLLLEHGASPNQKVYLNHDRTVWALFLISCYESDRRGGVLPPLREAWCRASELLILRGAELNCTLFTNDDLSASGILERHIFGPQKVAALRGILEEVERRKAMNTAAAAGGLSWIPRLSRALWRH